MACDRFTFSSVGNSAPRRSLRRYPQADAQLVRLPVMNPVVRQRNSRNDSLMHDLAVNQLAAAEARIAELEAALREAREVASHDPLTGALNRRGMNEAFAREKARAKRVGQPLAIALIDLDDFKCINDRHGHAVGDAALVQLTRILGETLRPTDICCRLGGEEFVLMMPGSDRAAARKALARVQEAMSAQAVAGTDVTLSFSAGVVQVDDRAQLEDVLVRADRAVYRAKAAGKRRVMSA
ncbi:MAG TPA: GGDEF domain-containing protein [Rhodocyclaceae bacterium]|nr:GGDEF domain-containing protein [Rhodocyclaceae bacterium]